ncbi:MAG: transglutaminase family protein [Rhodospirillales bacterium]|nr:transglutaminase family protein [Rhodospirillales bacterium]
MIYRVRHVTRYAYASPVDLATHMLHLRPRRLPWQRVVCERLLVEPAPVRREDGCDHFGNDVTWLFLDHPHEAFEVTMEAVVDVASAAPPPAAATPAWERVAAAARRGGAFAAAEFLFDSPMVPAYAAAGGYAAASFPPGRPVLEGLLDLNARFRRDFTFCSGATTLATPLSQILARREGVCQDFTHLMIAGLRALGLPARYTSGYIRTRPPPGQPRRRGADQSHAWVGAWTGPEAGWVHLDPTNGIVARDEHVVLGWGRDYSDVSPVRGVILGGGAHGLTVSVDLEPV